MKREKAAWRNPALFSAFLAFFVLASLLVGDYPRPHATSEQNFLSPDRGIFAAIGPHWNEPALKSTPRGSTKNKRPSSKLPARKPPSSKSKLVNNAAKNAEITVTKSSAVYDFNRKASKPGWRFLTRSVRAKIDSAKVRKGQWRTIVIHSSATTEGSARSFDYYHRQVKHMEHGLAYQFVIGNGHGSGNGQIEVGGRWLQQLPGGHLRSEAQNQIAIGICLVGDFQNNRVTQPQLEALDELIDYLQAKLGKIQVTTHRRINVRPTLCPGRKFPDSLFVQ